MQGARIHNFRGEDCPVLAEGKVTSYGEVLGKYLTFGYRDAHYTTCDIRGHQVTVIGCYYDCKMDPVAGVAFVSIGYNNHNGVIAVDISRDQRNARFVSTYNSLYVATIQEDLPVNVEISDSMIIAWCGENQALINQIVETPEEFIILGYKDEKLCIPRKRKTEKMPVVSSGETQRVSREDEAAAELAAEQESQAGAESQETHRFRNLEG